MKEIIVLFAALIAISVWVVAEETTQPTSAPSTSSTSATAEQHVVFTPADLKWSDAPPGLPPGAKIAALEGDPTKPGPFVLRMKAPANYKIAPHIHPTGEHITVISGTMNFGMGEKFDKDGPKTLSAGGYISLPAGMPHFAWSASETIVQIHGTGPFEIKYVNPEADPRNKK